MYGWSDLYRSIGFAMLTMHDESRELAVAENEPKIRIVIVEKHVAVRNALRKRLGAADHLDIVATLENPAEALPYLGSGCTVDVVLLGLQNGSDQELLHTLEIVRQMAAHAASVLVLAPFADEVERLLMQQAGASNYLLKYIDSHHLIHEIEAAAQRNSGPLILEV